MKKLGVYLFLAVGVFILPFFIAIKHRWKQPAQAIKNLEFIATENLLNALSNYITNRPPLYPLLLWFTSRLSIQPLLVNSLLFSFLIVTVYLFLKKESLTNPTLAALALLVCSPFYWHIYHVKAEMMFTLLSFLSLVTLYYYLHTKKLIFIVLLSFFVGTTSITRYFGIFWLFPLVTTVILSVKTKRLHLVIFNLIVIAISSPWFIYVKTKTGYWTGVDRFSPRKFEQFTSFDNNLWFTLKTLALDLLSPSSFAHLRKLLKEQMTLYELIGIGVIVVLLGLLTYFLLINLNNIHKLEILSILFFLSYLAVVIFLWSIGNVDPVNSRFLLPSYPFLIVSLFGIYNYLSDKKRYLLNLLLIIYLNNNIVFLLRYSLENLYIPTLK